jgi:hypothetical protein
MKSLTDFCKYAVYCDLFKIIRGGSMMSDIRYCDTYVLITVPVYISDSYLWKLRVKLELLIISDRV